MLTRLTIRNFKRFGEVVVELGESCVFIGPNNSGKTSAMQALALWDLGLRRWLEKRGDKPTPKTRPGVTINRRDLIALPVPEANLLWRNLRVRDVRKVEGRQQTRNICVEIVVEGVTGGSSWVCGLEFDYANNESFYVRPLRTDGRTDGGSEGRTDGKADARMPVPERAAATRIAFLPPMSGLAAVEDRLDQGSIHLRIGEGRTAEVLRNLCHRIADAEDTKEWEWLCARVQQLFGVALDRPEYIAERGQIAMTYVDPAGVRLDLSSAGRGLHQTLLLLAHMSANPGSVVLLDEPDAHLELLRQRQIYQLLTETARAKGCQIVCASHSEVILNEAADRDVVVAFVGKPHRIDDRGSQVLKALKEIGFEHYYQAEVKGWVLYLEGSTDLAILRAFAQVLEHPAAELLEQPYVHYVGNQPQLARSHFYGLRAAKPDLVGVALYDRLERDLPEPGDLVETVWERREIENYLCAPEVLGAYAAASPEAATAGPLFDSAERAARQEAMRACIADLVPPVALRERSDRWWRDTKATDEFLDRLFVAYFARLGLPNLMRKTDYHQLARLVPADALDDEVSAKLDLLVEVFGAATPTVNTEE